MFHQFEFTIVDGGLLDLSDRLAHRHGFVFFFEWTGRHPRAEQVRNSEVP